MQICRWQYQNNGEVWGNNTYVYKENQRIDSFYGQDGSQWSESFEILDKNNNVIEQYSIIEGKIENNMVFTYKFDAQGNWIEQNASEKKKVKGKTVLSPLWKSSRTITYYS